MSAKSTDSLFEIPPELRDFADRSVEQARKAVDGLLTAAHKTTGMAEASAKAMHEQTHTFTSRVMAHVEANITAALDLAQSLSRAKTMEEMTKLQTDFMKKQMEALQSQAKDMGEIVKTGITPGVKK
jgi:phasin